MNRNLIIVLVVLVLGAGGFYAYRWHSRSAEIAAGSEGGPASFSLWCPECKKSFEFTKANWKTVKQENGKFQCPECKKFECNWGPPPPPPGAPVMP